MNVVLVIGNDKIGRSVLPDLLEMKDIKIVLDGCTSFKRTIKLIRSGSLPVLAVLKMLLANIKRKESRLCEDYPILRTNKELLEYIDSDTIVVLFRAGLIINSDVISSANRVLNIHCANIPEFGGIASIHRALEAKEYSQNATLHQVTSRIDEGEVYDVESYVMDASESYFRNEEIAYLAGRKLLKRTILNLRELGFVKAYI